MSSVAAGSVRSSSSGATSATACSNHNYYIYEDLLNTTPKLRPTRFGQLCVADITYVATESGWAYLSLVTDAASCLIVG